MMTTLYVLHFMVCFVLIAVVLLQRGKGADLGAALGGGGANTVFGGRGAGNFLTKITAASAAIFMCTSLSLAYLGTQEAGVELFGDDDVLYLPRPLALNAQHNFARLQGSLIRRDSVFSCGLSNPEYSSFNDTELLNRVALEGPWVVTSRVFAREIRRSEETVGIGEARIKRPFTGFINLHRQTDTLLGDPRITPEERSQLLKNAGRYAFYAATSLIRFGRRAEARRYLGASFRHVRSPRTALTFLLTFAPQAILTRFFR